MRSRVHPRKLLVEGDEDKRVIPELIEANGVPWGQTADSSVVYIESLGGWQKILKPGVIETEIKSSGLNILGVLLDANDSIDARWDSLRARCVEAFPNTPAKLPVEGLIVENGAGKRFGAWFLPDNEARGMMETFLSLLVPNKQDSLWTHAVEAADEASKLGAAYSNVQRDKACIHTWLAWSNPPGRQLHQAVTQRILDPTSEYAHGFVAWFKKLYEIP